MPTSMTMTTKTTRTTMADAAGNTTIDKQCDRRPTRHGRTTIAPNHSHQTQLLRSGAEMDPNLSISLSHPHSIEISRLQRHTQDEEAIPSTPTPLPQLYPQPLFTPLPTTHCQPTHIGQLHLSCGQPVAWPLARAAP